MVTKHIHLLSKGDKVILASHNRGKLHEFSILFQSAGINLCSAIDKNLPEPEETGTTFRENAELKALAAAKVLNMPALADDSGFCVTALGGEPGIYSARWGGPSRDMKKAMEKVYHRFITSGMRDKSAEFITVLCLAFPNGKTYFSEGTCKGEICWPPRGDDGHGYDPMFIPSGEKRSFGEMSDGEKNSYSHRAIAVKEFLTRYIK